MTVGSPGLLDAAPDVIVGLDREGCIVLANARTAQMFGYAAAELVGRPIGVLLPDLDRAWLREAVQAPAAEAPGRWPVAVGRGCTARRRDDSRFPADVSLSPPLADGDPLVLAIRDVTHRPAVQAEQDRLEARAERERMEARLLRAQRLESLGQLAGGVAHDFNNLLAVIMNYAAFVAEEIEQAAIADPDRWHAVARDMHQIQRATERGIALTHQLLAFGRREVVRPVVLSVNAVIREVQQLLLRSIGEHVQLVVSLAPGLWAVQADPGQLEQVLINLAVNSRDAMPGGGTLTIDTANVESLPGGEGTPAASGRRCVRIRVQDTGAGMPQHVVERAFEPFFTTKPTGEGTGLGLATVYGIVTQAGGEVHVYSEVGIGTTFHLLLPAVDEPVAELAEPTPATARTSGRSGETILLVEDEAAIREVARRILGREGYQVIVAGTGAEALDLAGRHAGPVELLMTDVVMPRMPGKEVAARLRATRPEIRVLYVSGYAQPVLATTGTVEPGITLLQKPFTESALLDAVRRVLDSPG